MNIKPLIKQFGPEFQKGIWPKLPDSQYGNFESMVLYCILRKYKPKKIIEIGTETRGRSSFIIQSAIQMNKQGFQYMLDFPEVVRPAYQHIFDTFENAQVTMIPGPLETAYEKLPLEDCDFLFIDADHERSFAAFYLDHIVSKLPQNTLVHIHDVNLSGDWQWRATLGSEVEEFIYRKVNNIFTLKKELWVEDWCLNPEYKEDWEKLQKEYPFMGDWANTELPFTGSASYWRTE